jgi:ABC-2 type transport system ATP-binding protein
MEEADVLCEIVAFMDQGALKAVGNPAVLKAQLGRDATLDDVFIRYTGASLSERGGMRDVARTRRTAARLE